MLPLKQIIYSLTALTFNCLNLVFFRCPSVVIPFFLLFLWAGVGVGVEGSDHAEKHMKQTVSDVALASLTPRPFLMGVQILL